MDGLQKIVNLPQFKKAVFKNLIFLFLLNIFAFIPALNANPSSKLKNGNFTSLSDTETVRYYIILSKQHLDTAITLSEHYGKKALSIANQSDDLNDKAESLLNLGEVYYYSGKYFLALNFYKASLNQYRLAGNYSGAGNAYTGLAKIKNWQGQYKEAISKSFYAIRLFQLADDHEGIAKAFNTIGIAYDKSNQKEKAKQYYHKAFHHFLSVNNLQGMANTLNNLAIIYGKEGEIDESLSLLKQSLQLNRQLNNTRSVSSILNNIGNIYRTIKNFSEAEQCFNEAMLINLEISNTRGLLFTFLNLTKLSFEINQFQKSLIYLDQSVEIALQLGLLPQLAECYEMYSNIYQKTGDFQKALEFYQKFKEVDDSLKYDEVNQSLFEKEEQFQFESNKKALAIQTKDNEILKLKLDKSSWLKNFIFGILLSLIAFLILLYIQYRNKSKLNEYLAKLNKDLSDANMKLIESETKLMEWNSTKDKFFSIISHDLRNPIASLVSFVRIMNRDIDVMTTDEIRQLVADMKTTIERAQELLENLLLWSKTQTGKIMFQPERFNLYDAVHENVHLFQSALSQKQISMQIFVENPCFVYGDFNMIKTIVRNLLSNAIKFTRLKGNIRFHYEETNQYYIFRIEDDGVGMKPEEINLLFTPGGKRSRQGTADEKGSGIGLLICREFIDKHNGHIEITSEPGKGSIFSVYIPVKSN
jgi:signal transduction histidine kinase/Flp pilus assembly protein TadD